MLGRKLIDHLCQQSFKSIEIFDTSLGNKKYKYGDISIRNPSEMPSLGLEVIVLATSDFQSEMLEVVKEVYNSNSKKFRRLFRIINEY